MQVRFWGTRGSIAKPGPTTARFGGNTSCVQVITDDGTLIVLDCGTGGHGLGQALMASADGPVRGHMLISHTHWDHIQGLPFFAPFFVPGNQWEIYGPRGLAQGLREALAGQMQHTYFPIALEDFGAQITYHDLVEGSFRVGDVEVHTHYLNHPALALGYRIEADGASVVYCCDHEPHLASAGGGDEALTGADKRYVDFVTDSDVVVHDAQYTAAEYPDKVGWGHSAYEYAMRVCAEGGVRKLVLTHHDPLRDDAAVAAIETAARARADAQGLDLEIVAAAEGMTLDVVPGARGTRAQENEIDSALNAFDPGLLRRRVIYHGFDAETIDQLSRAADEEGLTFRVVDDPGELAATARDGNSAVILVEQASDDADATARAREALAVIAEADPGQEVVRALVVPATAQAAEQAEDVQILALPFSLSYARRSLHAWILRRASRWQRGPIPDDEARRIASLHALEILDSEPEERYDRITRIAARTFDVPVALVSLVDVERQWFKSCVGTEERETPRDLSFCAHAVARRDTLVIPDTLQDDRFAENPLVMSDPRLRFYAGAPLFLDDGSCIGTLCILDMRPRQLSDEDIEVLQDLRDLVIEEIRGGAAIAEA